MRIVIPDFPFPPSSNHTRGSFFDKSKTYFSKKLGKQVQGKMRHYDTKVYREYKQACADWALTQFRQLRLARPMIQEAIKDQKTALSVSTFFVFNFSNLWSADGRMKEVDASNRIKACHDELARHLEVDDRFFNVKTAEKVWVHDHLPERVVVEIKAEKLRTVADIEGILLTSRVNVSEGGKGSR